MKGCRTVALWALTLFALGCPNEPDNVPPPSPIPFGPRVAAGDSSAEEVAYPPTFYAPSGGDGKLHVYFFDVGHGEASLIVSPTGVSVLVDGGPVLAGRNLVHRLPELLHQPPDFVVLSTQEPEHYGGLGAVIASLGAQRYLDTQLSVVDPTYQSLHAALVARKVKLFSLAPDPNEPDSPVSLQLGGGAALHFYWPRAPAEALLAPPDALQKNSIVMRLTYGKTSFMFTGDAHEETEAALLARRIPLHATLLKVASHGDGDATSASFLQFVTPKVAYLTEGPGASPPSGRQQTIERLSRANARVFLASDTGELHAVSDGKSLSLIPEKPLKDAPAGKPIVITDDAEDEDEGLSNVHARGYVAARDGRVFHRASCASAEKIPPGRRLTFTSRKAAARGRKPAKDCQP